MTRKLPRRLQVYHLRLANLQVPQATTFLSPPGGIYLFIYTNARDTAGGPFKMILKDHSPIFAQNKTALPASVGGIARGRGVVAGQ